MTQHETTTYACLATPNLIDELIGRADQVIATRQDLGVQRVGRLVPIGTPSLCAVRRNRRYLGAMARDVVIESPVINSPFRELDRHFRFDEQGIAEEVVDGRRSSSYFIPIVVARKRFGQQAFETEWTADRLKENENINPIRERVDRRREGEHLHVTPTAGDG